MYIQRKRKKYFVLFETSFLASSVLSEKNNLLDIISIVDAHVLIKALETLNQVF